MKLGNQSRVQSCLPAVILAVLVLGNASEAQQHVCTIKDIDLLASGDCDCFGGTACDFAFGLALASDDADGDGKFDLLIGNPAGNSTNFAEAWKLGVAMPPYTGGSCPAPASFIFCPTLGTPPYAGLGVDFGHAVDFFQSDLSASGDGINDIIIGAPNEAGFEGEVFVLDSATGMPLFGPGLPSMIGNPGGDNDLLSRAVLGAADLGHTADPDFIAGAPLHQDVDDPTNEGYFRIMSGADGSVIPHPSNPPCVSVTDFTATSEECAITLLASNFPLDTVERLGWSMDEIGDLNGLGTPDFMVGAPKSGLAGRPGSGIAIAYSGETLGIIGVLAGVDIGDEFGSKIAGLGDVTGDGIPDVAVGARKANNGLTFPLNPNHGAEVGSVSVFSGADILTWDTLAPMLVQPLYTRYGDENSSEHGTVVTRIADADGDGFDEVAERNFGPGTQPIVRVFSGHEGGHLMTLTFADSLEAEETCSIVGIPGFANGGPAVAVGGFNPVIINPINSARVEIYSVGPSGKDIEAFPSFAHAAMGGVQQIFITAGPAHAGKTYALYGSEDLCPSATCMTPSCSFFGADYPLCQTGSYFTFTFNNPNNGNTLFNTLGTLDQQGSAIATIRIPAGAFPAGTTLHHAYIVGDPTTGMADMASAAVSFDLLL